MRKKPTSFLEISIVLTAMTVLTRRFSGWLFYYTRRLCE